MKSSILSPDPLDLSIQRFVVVPSDGLWNVIVSTCYVLMLYMLGMQLEILYVYSQFDNSQLISNFC